MKGAKHHALRAASDDVQFRYRRMIARRWSRLEQFFTHAKENELAFAVVVVCLGFLPCLLMAVAIFS